MLTCNVFSSTEISPFDGEPYPLGRMEVEVAADTIDVAFWKTKRRLAKEYGTTPEYVHITGVSHLK